MYQRHGLQLLHSCCKITPAPETTSEASEALLGCGEKALDYCSVILKSFFGVKVTFPFNLDIKIPECGRRESGTESKLYEVQREVSIVSHMKSHVFSNVGPLCFIKVQSQCRNVAGNSREFHDAHCWQALWRC